MEIELIAVGKTTTSWVETGINQYMQRLIHYIPFRLTALPDVRKVRNQSESMQKELEGQTILQRISASDFVVLLDEHGREYRSVDFAAYIQKQMLSGRKRVVFVIGGPYGFSQSVYDRADSKMSLSQMTFNHEMVRLFYVEQLYRAMTILRGEPYHHE